MSGRLIAAALILALLPIQAWSQQGSTAQQLLVSKARALNSRGRHDLAARTWKQVLLNEPQNVEALAALSRYAREAGDEAGAKQYLNQLRKVQPDAPTPGPAPAAAPRDPRLRQAEALAQAGKYEEALRSYEEIFGKDAPPAAVAAQYYETMAGVKGRTDEAVAGLNRLLKTSPESNEYRLTLGRIRTYRPQTRAQGMRMLQSIPSTSAYGQKARAAWRQALIWDNGEAGSLPLLRDYLALYTDPELAKLLSTAASTARPAAQSPDESAGYEALNSGKTDAAVASFEKAIQATPRSGTAYAGLGYARMKQQNWADAAKMWDQAIKFAPAKKEYVAARGEARYFMAMDEGTKALAQGDAAFARTRFEAALAFRPMSVDAQRGLAGALLATGDGKLAAGMFEKMVSAEPTSIESWRNLITSRATSNDESKALALWQKAPEVVKAALRKDVEFQLLLGGLYLTRNLPADAAASYQAAAEGNPKNVVAWEGWLAALMASKDEAKAYETLSAMPVEVYTAALERPGFLRSAALIQMHLGRLDVVESLLLRWISREGEDKVPADIQIQLAGVWQRQGKTDQAEKLLRNLLAKDPGNTDATRLLLAVLQSEGRSAEALVESKKIPVMAQAKLLQDPDYLVLIASINSDAGNQGEALRLVRETMGRFSQKGEQAPAPLLIQNAWLLLNSGADGRELFSLMRMLGSRSDLTAPEQATYLDIWSVWAQRQADQAHRAGDLERAIAILAEAGKLLPNDGRIRSTYAGYLLKSGETKKALAVYKAWGLTGATPTDYSAAIGTAMAERSELSKRWLDEGMKKYPSDPQILGLAGEMAMQRGDFKRAEAYYRSALALAAAKPKPDTAPLFANREHGNALGRLIVGDEALSAKESSATEQLGRVLSGEASSGTLSAGGSEMVKSAAPVKSESDQLGERLQAITARNAPAFDVSTSVQARSGTPGFDRRTLFETEIGTSKVFANQVRMNLVVKPVSIRTEASDGSSTTFRLGLLPAGSSFAAQNISGLAAELQLSTENFGLRGGVGPQGFLVKNYVGGLRFRPAGGHMTIQLTRDNVKDSLLSYAGQLDPITKRVWGGVVSNQGQLTGNWGDEESGFYVSGGYGIITGRDVATNHMFNGNGGTYWRVLQMKDNGALTVGLNLTGQAFEKNLRYYSLGQGGYFSPQRFYIFNVPVTWRGTYGTRLRYVLNAGLGTQHFREDSSPYFPTLASLQNATLLYYSGQSQTGASYSVDFRGIYQIAEQWYLEGFFNLNNARNFTEQSAGFTLKYGFRPRPVGAAFGPAEVPDWKGAQPLQP
jgi:tetratricopeptide (TPR) repeat protein